MHPILFEIPDLGLDLPFLPFPIRSFGVMLALAFLVGVHLATRFSLRYGDDPEGDPARISHVAMACLIGVVAGGRLMYVIVEVARYLAAEDGAGLVGGRFIEDPLSILFVWQGGMVMYGGFFGAAGLGCWSAARNGMRPLAALDYSLVAGWVGLAVGRVGCLLVGDDYGQLVPESLSHLGFPITLTVPSIEWLRENPQSLFSHGDAGQVLWATQVWSSLLALVVAGITLRLLRKRRYPGHVATWILVLYAVARTFIEAFRGDGVRGLWLNDLVSTSQLISLAAFAVGVWLLYRNRGRREPMPGATPSPGAEAPVG